VEFEVAKGPNFAGSFTVVRTTCGTGCSYVVIVDVRTGRIFEDLPFSMITVGASGRLRGLSFRLDSRLMMVEGSVDGSRIPTRAYYEWVGTGLHLVQEASIGAH
jgi:hypothetical protein